MKLTLLPKWAGLLKDSPTPPAGGWALPPGVSLMGKLPGVFEDENMRAGHDGTLFHREHRLDEENARELNITFEKPAIKDPP
jgi:hypothetical protein